MKIEEINKIEFVNELKPDYIDINIIWADPKVREECEEFNRNMYPILDLAKIKKDKGVYFYYEHTNDINLICPLYIGKTVSFNTRFNQHFNSRCSDRLNRYGDMIENETLLTEWPYAISIMIWMVEEEIDRKNLERKLINKINTYFNRANK